VKDPWSYRSIVQKAGFVDKFGSANVEKYGLSRMALMQLKDSSILGLGFFS
jgi:hypothetical protein